MFKLPFSKSIGRVQGPTYCETNGYCKSIGWDPGPKHFVRMDSEKKRVFV